MWTILKEIMSYGTDETDIWVAFKIRGKSLVAQDDGAPHPEFRQLQFIAFVACFCSSFYHTFDKAKENQNQRFLGSENDFQGVHQAEAKFYDGENLVDVDSVSQESVHFT